MRLLVVTLYINALNFVAAAAILQTGMGMDSLSLCRAGTFVCGSFYLVSKVLMYMFIIERAHSIRAPYTRRVRDWVWYSWTLILVGAFCTLIVLSFIHPIADVDNLDLKCRIGLTRRTSIVLIFFDIFVNFSLTAVFLWLLRPLLAFHQTSNPESTAYFRHRIAKLVLGTCAWVPLRLPQTEPYHAALNTNLVKAVEWLVWKTLAGTVGIVVPTIVNLSLLYRMDGREQGWLCFTM
jgi:hypothetical protein